jgi:hypothetical protein
MNWEKDWKGNVGGTVHVLSCYLLGATEETLCECIRCPVRDSNLEVPDYKSRYLLPRLRVGCHQMLCYAVFDLDILSCGRQRNVTSFYS